MNSLLQILIRAGLAATLAIGLSACANGPFKANQDYSERITKHVKTKTISRTQPDRRVLLYANAYGEFYPDEVNPCGHPGYDYADRPLPPECGYRQAEIIKRKAQQIIQQLQAARTASGSDVDRAPLVVIFGGFNVPDRRENYELTRKKISSHLGSQYQPVYLEVHWSGGGGWSNGQSAGVVAGARLRPLLNTVLQSLVDTPIRMITHSSGAFGAAALIGNSRVANPLQKGDNACAGEWHFYCDHAAEGQGGLNGPPNTKNLRVGMLAPATDASAFAPDWGAADGDHGRPNLASDGVMMSEVTLIFGTNVRDGTLNKWLLGSLHVAHLAGATGLGYRPKIYDRLLAALPAMQSATPSRTVRAHRVEFSNDPDPTKRQTQFWFWEQHSFLAYLKRSKMTPFLTLLFEVDPNEQS